MRIRSPKKTKIIATLGPASSSIEKIEELFLAGADIFRLNFSHGTHKEHAQLIKNIRTLESRYQIPLTIMMDLQGPKLRIGCLEEGHVELETGQTFHLDLINQPGNKQRVFLPHREIFEVLEPGMSLLLDDGKISLEVISCTSSSAQTRVTVGGKLSDHKGVNVPHAMLPISALTDKDKEDLDFALNQDIDAIALSFVQHPQDILEAKQLIKDHAKIVAKIEKPRALDYIEDIIAHADAIMVARGDLGVEMALEEVPCIQKKIIHLCRRAGKPVTVATQILESMVFNPTPTRAEASDLANAVYETADTVMLSAESATGKYPVEAVKIMDRIIRHVEQDQADRNDGHTSSHFPEHTITDAISIAVHHSSKALKAKAIIVFSLSGSTALSAARERPESPILALTPRVATARFLNMCWGVHPTITRQPVDFKHAAKEAVRQAQLYELVKPGECILVTAGLPEDIRDDAPIFVSGSTNFIQVVEIKDER